MADLNLKTYMEPVHQFNLLARSSSLRDSEMDEVRPEGPSFGEEEFLFNHTLRHMVPYGW